MKFAALLLAVLCTAAGLAQSAPPSTDEARYVIVLKRGAHAPDVAALGGRVEATNWWSLTVVIPVAKEAALAASPAVESLQRTMVGTSDTTPEGPAPRLHAASESFQAGSSSLSTLWKSGDYQYDGDGNITAIGTATAPNFDNKQSTFTYDLAGRLKTASIGRTAGDRVESYDYDGFGNLKTRQITGGVTYSPNPSLTNNRMQEALTDYFSTGSMKRHPNGDYFTYDAMDQVTTKAATENGTPAAMYFYTASDERIAVQTNGNVYWTIRDTDNKPLRQYRSTTLTDANWSSSAWTWVEDYIWNGDKLVAGERPTANGGRRHFHLDHLGTTRLITDNNRAALSTHDYSPYGEEITAVNQELSCCGREEPINFTGHERDFDLTQTGDNDNYFDYMHARYYDPNRGRFLSVDPGRDWVPSQPQSWNVYTYVRNNPVIGSDPTGQKLTLGGYRDFGLQRKVVGIANSGLHGTQLSIHPSGEARLTPNGVQGPPTRQQAALAATLGKAIDNGVDVSIGLVSGSPLVLVGSFDLGTIDVADLLMLGNGPGVSGVGALAHEVEEQYQKQVLGVTNYQAAHAQASAAESDVVGMNRQPQAPSLVNGGETYSAVTTYAEGNDSLNVVIEVVHNNVKGVRRERPK